MKSFNCLLIILFTSVSALSQDIVIESNASLEIQIGADICADSLSGDGTININGTFCGNTTDIEIKSTDSSMIIPDVFSLEQNYPNPFNPSTNIRFSLPVQTHLKIYIYNMLGELVKILSEGIFEAGYYNVTFNAAELSSGTYIYRIESEKFIESKKMILLR